MKRDNMRRSGVVMIIAVMLFFCLTGCGNAADTTDQIRTAADGLMSSLQAWDTDKISEYVTDDALTADGDLEFVGVIDGFSGSFVNSLDIAEEELSEEALASVEDFGDTISRELIKSYELGEITEEEGNGIVKCTITFGYDSDALFDCGEKIDAQALTTGYTQEHIDELAEIYNTQGEDAVRKALMNGVVPLVMTSMKDYVLSTDEKVEDYRIIVEDIDGKWLVTGMKVSE